jgi:hypothetical protein
MYNYSRVTRGHGLFDYSVRPFAANTLFEEELHE